MRNTVILAMAFLVTSLPLMAQQGTAATANQASCCESLVQQIKDLQERIIALEGEVRQLKQAQAVPTAPAPVAPAPVAPPAQAEASGFAGQLPVYGGLGTAAKALNPDISVIGTFVGAAGGFPTPPGSVIRQAGSRALEMHESEVGFQAIIDPYARGDFFLSFGEEGVDLEEGYITFTGLPAGLVARAGKMRAAFGRVNTFHNHVLPWVDRPLMTENLVGGEDGIDDAGVSVTRILPAPKWLFLEATGQVFRGDTGGQTFFTPTGTETRTLFTASRKSDVSTVAHLHGYHDITENTNLDIGLSYARGHNELGSDFLTRLFGVDATLRWKPLRRSIYHSFVGRTELVWSQRQQPLQERRAFGMYASADYQLGRRWFLGGRYDYADRARDFFRTDRGASAVLTYWPSEFSQIRGQYRFTRFAEGINANELLMQVQFVLGAHGAHPF